MSLSALNKHYELLISFVQYCNHLEEGIIIVEGKRDKETLQLLGVTSKIIVKGGFSICEIVDQVLYSSSKIIIVLTDFDKEGKSLRHEIKREIQTRKKHGSIDAFARQLLFKFCKANKISEIEDLSKFNSIIESMIT